MWDGQQASLLGWIAETTRMKEIRNLPDELVIRYARLRLESKLQEVYPTENPPETWEQLTTLLKNIFFPRKLVAHLTPAVARAYDKRK